MSASQLTQLCSGYDLIIPALENNKVLERLDISRSEGDIPPLAFDYRAYKTSCSKIRSKALFNRLGLPMAAPWAPGAEGSFVAKPSVSSGSRSVLFFDDSREIEQRFPTLSSRCRMVIEEKLIGPSYSVEVVSVKGLKPKTFQVTLLEMDDTADCCRVIAPSNLPKEKEKALSNMAKQLAADLELTGLMDLEAIDHNGKLTLTEIDARFPSQTPTAIYWSTGVNLLYELAKCFVDVPGPAPVRFKTPRKVVYEHVLAKKFDISFHGEHLMTTMGPLTLRKDFMGAQEALVAGKAASGHYAATMIRLVD
jgi:pyrrolysine biosynthesis protein PylC